jgi:hypothetical protein
VVAIVGNVSDSKNGHEMKWNTQIFLRVLGADDPNGFTKRTLDIIIIPSLVDDESFALLLVLGEESFS